MNTKILCFLPWNKEECIQFQSKLEKCDCFNTLLFLLNINENISFKVRISIILGNFYKYIVIPNEGKIIINILINYLKEQSTKKSNKDENNELLISVLNASVNISTGDNEKVVFIWKKTVLLLSNICFIKSAENKNSIINCGIFDVFHKNFTTSTTKDDPIKLLLNLSCYCWNR
jgi:hypothetical protein